MDIVGQDKLIPTFTIEQTVKSIEKCILRDASAPTLSELMNITPQSGPTVSGLSDHDYPIFSAFQSQNMQINPIKLSNKVSMPHEIMENFNSILLNYVLFVKVYSRSLDLKLVVKTW